MKDLKVIDVRSHPGDSAFLIDDGKTAILCDSGFAFTGYGVADNIKKALGERPLDYIFLTHSHYDHALGSAYALKYWPCAKVVAAEYAAKIFAKESARALMRSLDKKFAEICGVHEYEDLIDDLRVDIAVNDGDEIQAGDMLFKVVSLPGHTKCSTGFYLAGQKLLVGCETLGLYDGEKNLLPSFLVGYQMTLDSIDKARKLDIKNLLLPHFGLLDEEKTRFYFENVKQNATEVATTIADILRGGGSHEDAIDYFRRSFYHGKIKEGYPPDAMELNTGILVNLIERELVNI